MEQYTMLIFAGLFTLFVIFIFFKTRKKKKKVTKKPVQPVKPEESKKNTAPITISDLVKKAGNRENIIITYNDFKTVWKDIDGNKLETIRVSGPENLIERLYLNGIKQKGHSFDITNVYNFKLEYKAEDTDKVSTAEFNFIVKTTDQWSK